MKCSMLFLIVFLVLSSKNYDIVEGCLATASGQSPIVTSTEEPITDAPELNVCSSDLISFGVGDTNNPQVAIDVNHTPVVSTRIGTTLETTNSMTISCTAIDGDVVYMDFGNLGHPNNLEQQTLSVPVVCNSTTQIWYWDLVNNGQTLRIPVTTVTCDQI